MAELKTKPTKISVTQFINAIEDDTKRDDAKKLLKLFREVSGEKPVLWGTSIIGFGKYHYKSERSRQEGDWPLTGFSPRKQNMTIYIMPGFKNYANLLKKLGPHKISVGCLYIKRLSDVDLRILAKLIEQSILDMRKKYKLR